MKKSVRQLEAGRMSIKTTGTDRRIATRTGMSVTAKLLVSLAFLQAGIATAEIQHIDVGPDAVPLGISPDGEIVVGTGGDDPNQSGFIWRTANETGFYRGDALFDVNNSFEGGNRTVLGTWNYNLEPEAVGWFINVPDASSEPTISASWIMNEDQWGISSGPQVFEWPQFGYTVRAGNAAFFGGYFVGAMRIGDPVEGPFQIRAYRASYSLSAPEWNDLPPLAGDTHSMAIGISADGNTVVGESGTGIDFNPGSFHPDPNTMTITAPEPIIWGIWGAGGLGFAGEANEISADGTTVVGAAYGYTLDPNQQVVPWEAYRWTGADGKQILGCYRRGTGHSDCINFSIFMTSTAEDVSADGAIVVGGSHDTYPYTSHKPVAFWWWQGLAGSFWPQHQPQMHNLEDLLTAQGDDLSDWRYLYRATAVSDDGKKIAGYGVRADGSRGAFLATLYDTDEDGVIDALDNCIGTPNGPEVNINIGDVQVDTNQDGFGNVCDADLTDDGVVNGLDAGPFIDVFGTSDADADFNSDGVVNGLDVDTFINSFGAAPGPSGFVQ